MNEATDNLKFNGEMAEVGFEPRYHDLAHRFAPFVERANADRRSKHRHRSHHKNSKKDKKKSSKSKHLAESQSEFSFFKRD